MACVARQTSSSKLTSHSAVELSGKSTMLTMEHEVDVALFLLITNGNHKLLINAHEKNLGPCLVPLNIGSVWMLRTGTSWHSRVIVTDDEEGVSQVYRVSSIKLKPKTASWVGRIENKPIPCLGVPVNILSFSVYSVPIWIFAGTHTEQLQMNKLCKEGSSVIHVHFHIKPVYGQLSSYSTHRKSERKRQIGGVNPLPGYSIPTQISGLMVQPMPAVPGTSFFPCGKT